MMIYADRTNEPELKNLCTEIYQTFPGLSNNNIDDIMKTYMTEEQFALSQKKAIYQQGILNIYNKYCQNHLCDLCKENDSF